MLGPLALKAWDAMWKLYDKKYGKYGEATVKALKRELKKVLGQTQIQREEIVALRTQVDDAEKMVNETKKALDECRAKYNQALAVIAARDDGVRPVSENPYDE